MDLEKDYTTTSEKISLEEIKELNERLFEEEFEKAISEQKEKVNELENYQESKKDYIEYITSNPGYLFWISVNFLIFFLILGFSFRTFFILLILYSTSIALAISNIGEKLLQYKNDIRPICTNKEKERLIPIFEETYQNAKTKAPYINENIQLYIADDIAPFAFAIGRKTIAISRGLIEMMNDEELKGIIAHEIAHICNGDTVAKLIATLGNTILVWGVYLVREGFHAIISMIDKSSIIGFIGRATLRIFDAIISIFALTGFIITGINSRENEYRADRFSYDIGHSDGLISALYKLDMLSLTEGKRVIKEKIKASHPKIPFRIERLEESIGIAK